MSDDLDAIVAGLADREDVTAVRAVADRCVADGTAADLGIALWQRYVAGTTRPPRQYGSVLDHLLQRLTSTPGPADVAEAVRLVGVVAGRRQTRRVASLLAAGQSPADLTPVFAGDEAGEELRDCLAQELVLRDVPVDPAWYASHPDLGALPPARTEVERGRRTAAPPPAPGPAAAAVAVRAEVADPALDAAVRERRRVQLRRVRRLRPPRGVALLHGTDRRVTRRGRGVALVPLRAGHRLVRARRLGPRRVAVSPDGRRLAVLAATDTD